LLALSGFEYDGPAKALRFTPRYTPSNFKSVFIGPEGWGSLRQIRSGRSQRNEVVVTEGILALSQLVLDLPGKPGRVSVSLGHAPIPATLKPRMDGITVALARPVVLKRGERMVVSLG